MLNEAFDAVADHPERDFYPAALRPEIDALNARVYETVNNGVYRAGFAPTQEAYEEAVLPLFDDTGHARRPAGRPPLPSRRRPRRSPTGASFRRCCASTPSTSGTSSATSAGSPTIRTSVPTCATCTRRPASPRRSTSTTSSATTTPPTANQPDRHRPRRPAHRPRRAPPPRGSCRLTRPGQSRVPQRRLGDQEPRHDRPAREGLHVHQLLASATP